MAGGPIALGETYKKNWNDSMPSMDKNFEKQLDLVKVHLITAQEVLTAYNKIVELCEATMTLAN